jgi:protein-tyrosine phosphatase
VDWFVREMRFGFYDHDMSDFNPEDLRDIVTISHRQWKSGNRVLIRCQAGLNRSGLVMALVLIREGYTPAEAIHLIRSQRGQAALCNSTFERWLLSVDVEQWRS